jgi:hypothetical protein
MLHQKGTIARLAGIVVLLGACQAGSPTDPTADQAANTGQVSTGGTSTGGTTPSSYYTPAVRITCEVRSNRSKISVDGRSLRPADGTYSARARSGANLATAPAKTAVGGEVEFDFDSDAGDIAAGAVAIAPTFIATDVTGEILDLAGKVVAAASAKCTAK